jgi:uncharacterized protein YbjQ (UPF0145 family)
VAGINIFKDFMASWSDTFGGRSKTTQRILREVLGKALEELLVEADVVGANAVIAVDLNFAEYRPFIAYLGPVPSQASPSD